MQNQSYSQGGTAIRAAKREVAKTGFDENTGMLLPKTPEKKMEESKL